MISPLVLSLFPGIGLFDMAWEEAGCCVVRGPDVLWGGDIKTFHPPAGRFDGIIGGPPCQAFSRMRHIVEHLGYTVAENLIPEYIRVVNEAQPRWFVMENVPGAPIPDVDGYAISHTLLNNRWFGGVQHRQRRFTIGVRGGPALELWRWLRIEAVEAVEWKPAVLSSGLREIGMHKGRKGGILKDNGNRSQHTVVESCRLQGLPADFLSHAPFTVHGKQKVLGNGVPLPMGRAVANAVLEAMGHIQSDRKAA